MGLQAAARTCRRPPLVRKSKTKRAEGREDQHSDLRGADLGKAHARSLFLANAIHDDNTTLPAGMDTRAEGMRFGDEPAAHGR